MKHLLFIGIYFITISSCGLCTLVQMKRELQARNELE